MKLSGCLVVLFLFCSLAVMAQPVWSPGKRSEMEMEWMRDSLHITPRQEQKAAPVSLHFQEQMDKSNGAEKTQHDLMRKKDAAMKSVLNREQYKKYYRREKEIRLRPKVKPDPRHQAY